MKVSDAPRSTYQAAPGTLVSVAPAPRGRPRRPGAPRSAAPADSPGPRVTQEPAGSRPSLTARLVRPRQLLQAVSRDDRRAQLGPRPPTRRATFSCDDHQPCHLNGLRLGYGDTARTPIIGHVNRKPQITVSSFLTKTPRLCPYDHVAAIASCASPGLLSLPPFEARYPRAPESQPNFRRTSDNLRRG